MQAMRLIAGDDWVPMRERNKAYMFVYTGFRVSGLGSRMKDDWVLMRQLNKTYMYCIYRVS